MRFNEFKITKEAINPNSINLGPAGATPGAPPAKEKEGVYRAFRKDGSFYVPAIVGNKGPEIADLQKALIALGYPLPKYGVDGMMGIETKTAVKAFQTAKRLSVDGIAGKDTIAAINSAITADPKIAASLRQSTQADVKTKINDFDKIKGDVTGAAGATGTAQSAVKFFTNKGWTPEQAAGIVGNLQAESGANLKIDALGDKGQAYGIAQWHPDRQSRFNKVIGKDIRQSSLEDQLAFVDWELNNTESAAGRQLKKTTTPEQAAWVMDEYYERSSGAHRQNRINNAIALAPTTTTTA
jgi:peptidoglycan hydrolase-like protein with peptidoglycan-binding domain